MRVTCANVPENLVYGGPSSVVGVLSVSVASLCPMRSCTVLIDSP